MKSQLLRLVTIVAIAASSFSCSTGKYYMFSAKQSASHTIAKHDAKSTETNQKATTETVANSDLTVYASTDATPTITKSEVEQLLSTPNLAKQALAEITVATPVTKAEIKQAKKIEKLKKKIDKASETASGGKSQLVALLLAIFVGGLGIHRFYLGYTTIGIIQLLTLGGCGLWALIDLIRIATGDLTPKDGDYDKTL